MALSDTKIHHIELLLTLDYLLNHTDEFNPATQIDICEHAKNYGLKFDKNAKAGNQVRRQRISECLKFLKQITNDFPDAFPFVLETTDSRKYYIEQRHGLNEDQVAKILAAISNDKYTKDEDVNFLIDRVLSAFSTSAENRHIISNKYKSLLVGGKRYSKEVLRKTFLIEKAYRESKLIKIKSSGLDAKTKKIVNRLFWYRVYLIKEYRHKLYALMFPIGEINADIKKERLYFSNYYIFDSIENIDVVNDSEKNVLCNDFDEHRDFEKIFQQKCSNQAKKYGTIDNMLKQSILPNGGNISIVSFSFNLGLLDILKRSFEEFFSESLRYQEMDIPEESKNKKQAEPLTYSFNWRIKYIEDTKKACPKYGLVNISVDEKSFKSWLLSDPFGDGNACIADMVTIIKPTSLNKELAMFYFDQLRKRREYLTRGQILYLAKTLDVKPNIK